MNVPMTSLQARVVSVLLANPDAVERVLAEVRDEPDGSDDAAVQEELQLALEALEDAGRSPREVAGQYARACLQRMHDAGFPTRQEREAFRMTRESSAIRYRRQHRQPAPREVSCLDEKGMKIALQVAARRKCSFDEACRLLRR